MLTNNMEINWFDHPKKQCSFHSVCRPYSLWCFGPNDTGDVGFHGSYFLWGLGGKRQSTFLTSFPTSVLSCTNMMCIYLNIMRKFVRSWPKAGGLHLHLAFLHSKLLNIIKIKQSWAWHQTTIIEISIILFLNPLDPKPHFPSEYNAFKIWLKKAPFKDMNSIKNDSTPSWCHRDKNPVQRHFFLLSLLPLLQNGYNINQVVLIHCLDLSYYWTGQSLWTSTWTHLTGASAAQMVSALK